MFRLNDPRLITPGIQKGHLLRRHADGSITTAEDDVAVEEPLDLRIGKQTLAITMRTTGNDEELAAGFLAAEGIIDHPDDIKAMSHCFRAPRPENELRVLLNKKADSENPLYYGTISSSCGVCGKTSIDQVLQQRGNLLKNTAAAEESIILSLPEKLNSAQSHFQKCGGLHAAGLFRLNGELEILREDVGRHNAVDKTLGRAFLDHQWPLSDRILLVSGRVSYEILQKSLAAGIPIIAAISAPSTLAIRFARESGQTLIGFLRPPTFNTYAHPQRIRFSQTVNAPATQ